MMTVFAYIGIAASLYAVWFAHERCKYMFIPYERLYLNICDWFTMPYLMFKAYRYSERDLKNLLEYTIRAKQRWPIIFMRWYVEGLCRSRGL